MSKIYSHIPSAPDELLGRIDLDSGKVFETRFGPKIGRAHV